MSALLFLLHHLPPKLQPSQENPGPLAAIRSGPYSESRNTSAALMGPTARLVLAISKLLLEEFCVSTFKIEPAGAIKV
jgi:hypothetical protein